MGRAVCVWKNNSSLWQGVGVFGSVQGFEPGRKSQIFLVVRLGVSPWLRSDSWIIFIFKILFSTPCVYFLGTTGKLFAPTSAFGWIYLRDSV